jgi:hypothetical protein
VKTKITSSDRLSNAGLHRSGGLGSPQSRWSLRNAATGEYVNLYEITKDNDALRGDRTLDIEADLPEGIYILATGKDSDRIEQTITVGASAIDEGAAMAAALKSLPRLNGVSRKQTDYADTIRKGWVKEIGASKLSAERKADEYAALGKITSARAILDNKDRWPSDALDAQEAE